MGTGKIPVDGTVDTSCPVLGVAWVTPNPGFPIKCYLWFWNVVSDAYTDINIILCCALSRTLPSNNLAESKTEKAVVNLGDWSNDCGFLLRIYPISKLVN